MSRAEVDSDDYVEGRVFHHSNNPMRVINVKAASHISNLWSDDNERSGGECRCGWTYESGDSADVVKAWQRHCDDVVAPKEAVL